MVGKDIRKLSQHKPTRNQRNANKGKLIVVFADELEDMKKKKKEEKKQKQNTDSQNEVFHIILYLAYRMQEEERWENQIVNIIVV